MCVCVCVCVSNLLLMFSQAFLTEEEKELTTAFKQAADNLRESFRFAHTTAKEILSEFNFEKLVLSILHCFFYLLFL